MMLGLKKRVEFLAVSKGRKVVRRCLVLQARARTGGAGQTRVGYTVTKRTGNSVERNRIRRRLRAAVDRVGGSASAAGVDYVIIGRRAALKVPFDLIVSDLRSGFSKVGRHFSDPQQGM
jgi:ribonuclease P protein component